MTTTIVQADGQYFQEVHPFADTGWIKFHRSLVTQVIPDINSLATLKVLMLFLEQTTDRRDRDVPAELSIRLIARKMRMSPTSAEKGVQELLALGIVHLARPGDYVSAAVYELNREYVLREPVAFAPPADLPDGPAGVPEVGTPPASGVPEVVTLPTASVPEVGTPPAPNGGGVYQKLVQVIEEEIKREEEKEGEEETPPRPSPARVVVTERSIDRTPGGNGYRPPQEPEPPAGRAGAPGLEAEVVALVNVLVETTGLGGHLNSARLLAFARELQASHYTADQVSRHFGRPDPGPGVWWYWRDDWRGRTTPRHVAEPPSLNTIRERISLAVNQGAPVTAAGAAPMREIAPGLY
jgi:hypothetical protein